MSYFWKKVFVSFYYAMGSGKSRRTNFRQGKRQIAWGIPVFANWFTRTSVYRVVLHGNDRIPTLGVKYKRIKLGAIKRQKLVEAEKELKPDIDFINVLNREGSVSQHPSCYIFSPKSINSEFTLSNKRSMCARRRAFSYFRPLEKADISFVNLHILVILMQYPPLFFKGIWINGDSGNVHKSWRLKGETRIRPCTLAAFECRWYRWQA